MTNDELRERARQAVLDLYRNDDDYIGVAYEQADVASAVWEPALNEARAEIDRLREQNDGLYAAVQMAQKDQERLRVEGS